MMLRTRTLISRRHFVACSRLKSTMANTDLPRFDMESDHLEQKLHIPFSRSRIGPFFQPMPKLGNQFSEDITLRSYLRRHMPANVIQEITPDLTRFGSRVATDLYDLALECDKELPYLKHYDAWGKRIDEIITCPAWKQMKSVAAEEGLVAIGYERKYAQYSRLYQMAKLYMYSPSAGLYSCPLAMTDGASKSLEMLGDKTLMDGAFSHLTSRDPNKFWTSGQWMTERKGGSDVANGTQTLAVPQPDGSYKLYGYKWFTSATDSDMALTLGREVDANGQFISGTKGLSMFYLETRDSEGTLNSIEVQRLKDKLGTRQVPTAELLLDGTKAYRISDEGRGVASISTMLTITRLYNSVSAAGGMRRIVNLARDYATKREAFGKYIHDHAVHVKTLATMEVEARGALLLTLEMARVLGLQECNMATEHDDEVFRLLTPVIKLYTAKQAVAVASEGLECFGGAGYMEDTGLPRHLRDAQVLPIWEGTTNILSIDVLRAIAKSKGSCLKAFHKDIHQRSSPAEGHPELKESALKVKHAADAIVGFANEHVDKLELGARQFAYSLGSTYIGMLLLEHANWAEATPQDVLTAQRWCQKDLTPVITHLQNNCYDKNTPKSEFDLAFDGYVPTPGSKL